MMNDRYVKYGNVYRGLAVDNVGRKVSREQACSEGEKRKKSPERVLQANVYLAFKSFLEQSHDVEEFVDKYYENNKEEFDKLKWNEKWAKLKITNWCNGKLRPVRTFEKI